MALTIFDFVPPVFFKIARRLKRLRANQNNTNVRELVHPFNYLPSDIDAKLILDVGANLGNVARAALISYPEAKVICIEPVSATADILATNLKEFGLRTEIHRVAFSSKAGKTKINITPFHGANSIESQTKLYSSAHPQLPEESTEVIPLVTLDVFFNKHIRTTIDILKIDVEGHELAVIEGGRKTLRNSVRNVILEMSFYRDTDWHNQRFLDIFNALHKLGFYVVNVFDLYNYKGHESKLPIMVEQFDCAFRNSRFDAKDI